MLRRVTPIPSIQDCGSVPLLAELSTLASSRDLVGSDSFKMKLNYTLLEKLCVLVS